MVLINKVKDYTDTLEAQGLLRVRQLKAYTTPTMLHFDSNDYLSLIGDPGLTAAYRNGHELHPVGSGASMLLSGYHPAHQEVERAFADFLNVEECLLFTSGYAANLAITALLGQIKAHCVIDKKVHASIYDGLHLSKVHYSRFIHNDLDDLSHKLKGLGESSAVMTEGVFSMSGSIAPLADYERLCASHRAELIVDEAHSFGVLGEQGKGSVVLHGLGAEHVPLRVIPLGKACAAQGAIVAGKHEWISGLLQAGRSLIYSTAMSPVLCYGLLNTLELVSRADDRRLKLQRLIDEFKEQMKQTPLSWTDSATAIQYLKLGSPALATFYANELRKGGISCFAIRSPTVPAKESGIRIVLNYRHESEDIHLLVNQLNKIYEHQYNKTR